MSALTAILLVVAALAVVVVIIAERKREPLDEAPDPPPDEWFALDPDLWTARRVKYGIFDGLYQHGRWEP